MLQNIKEIASSLGLSEGDIELYGNYKAKVNYKNIVGSQSGKLILVTAITPTKAGEGKTTCSIALADGLKLIGKKVCLALREPSLGPVFGIKGGATGGGLVTVEPAEDINLHFTGDMHALTTANNLISAIIDNHIFQGNELRIDPNRVVFPRVMDMNDRALRSITVGQGKNNGVVRQDSFTITVASEMMAILCLSEDEDDFRRRLKRIIVAYDESGNPVRVGDLSISEAVMKVMKNALRPNLVQSSYNTPALIHGGPFANIAHGCNSIIATAAALKMADYVVTEAGFGSDLGAEKFLDIKCRQAHINPALIVVVASLRALKSHGGATDLTAENVEAAKIGFANLEVHVQNMRNFNKPVLVAINHFPGDTVAEIAALESWCRERGYLYSFVDGFMNGAEGAADIASQVVKILEETPETNIKYTYEMNDSIKEKILKVATKIYGASEVEYTSLAEEQLKEFAKLGGDRCYICIAKTPQSLSDDAKILNAPKNHILHVKSVRFSAGSEFIVPITGSILTMPGLPKIPAAVKMESENGN